MKERANLLGGIGGIAFGVLTVVALFVASPAGGSYAASDVQSFVASNHHAAVCVGLYLTTLGVLGLPFLLSRLREVIDAAGTSESGLLWRLPSGAPVWQRQCAWRQARRSHSPFPLRMPLPAAVASP